MEFVPLDLRRRSVGSKTQYPLTATAYFSTVEKSLLTAPKATHRSRYHSPGPEYYTLIYKPHLRRRGQPAEEVDLY